MSNRVATPAKAGSDTARNDGPPVPTLGRAARRLPRAGLVAAAVAVGLAAAAWFVVGRGPERSARPAERSTATATVSRQDLVDRDTFAGTLGYADTRQLTAGGGGTVTWLPEEGSVVTRGEALYRVNGKPVPLLYGSLPLWRTIGPGVEGGDVKQLEQNLRALGYDPNGDMKVDGKYDWATREAIERWQKDLGVTGDGRVDPGDAVFLPGPRRVGKLSTSIGGRVGPGAPVMETSSTRRIVTVKLEARRQTLVAVGQTVTVTLPDGRTLQGRIADVGKVATVSGGEDAEPTIDVTITLAGGARAGTLDQAPVDVGIAREIRRNVLTVPVSALLALAGGGYAVEVVQPDGTTRLVAVDPGLYTNGLVEIEGKGVREGLKVVVPQ